MKNEDLIATRIRQTLNQSTDDIPPSALRRLEAARHHALSKQKQTVEQMALATEGSHRLGNLFQNHRIRHMLAAFALLAGMAIAAYWQADDYLLDIEETDSALLSDELPPEAFIDKGFSTWLKDDAESR